MYPSWPELLILAYHQSPRVLSVTNKISPLSKLRSSDVHASYEKRATYMLDSFSDEGFSGGTSDGSFTTSVIITPYALEHSSCLLFCVIGTFSIACFLLSFILPSSFISPKPVVCSWLYAYGCTLIWLCSCFLMLWFNCDQIMTTLPGIFWVLHTVHIQFLVLIIC